MELTRAQVVILRTLRHGQSARYTALRQPTGLDSDVFKFHLRKLVAQGYVVKRDDGNYELTPAGKEFANNLSKTRPVTQKQPKLSVAIVAVREIGGATRYLMQRRLRQPFYGFWGCVTGPVQWGEAIEVTARREFEKQTGLTGSYAVRGFYRKTDYAAETDALLEDKLFAVVEATNVRGDITNAWPKGSNAWMSLDELRVQEKYFVSTSNFVDMIGGDKVYESQKAMYLPGDY